MSAAHGFELDRERGLWPAIMRIRIHVLQGTPQWISIAITRLPTDTTWKSQISSTFRTFFSHWYSQGGKAPICSSFWAVEPSFGDSAISRHCRILAVNKPPRVGLGISLSKSKNNIETWGKHTLPEALFIIYIYIYTVIKMFKQSFNVWNTS